MSRKISRIVTTAAVALATGAGVLAAGSTASAAPEPPIIDALKTDVSEVSDVYAFRPLLQNSNYVLRDFSGLGPFEPLVKLDCVAKPSPGASTTAFGGILGTSGGTNPDGPSKPC